MRQFMFGCVVGAALIGSFETYGADRNTRGTPLQQDYDRYRRMQQQLDTARMRDLMERDRFEKSLGLGRKPC